MARSARAPVCVDRHPPWADEVAKVRDGIPDPAGRIVFGQTSHSDIYGQFVLPLFAIDPDGSDLVQLFDCEMERPRFSPDGSRLAFTILMDDGTRQLATSAADGSELRVLTHTAGWAETPDWGPDGSWLIYALSDEQCTSPECESHGFHETLWRMDADGSDPRLVGDPDTNDWEPRLSPNGREVITLRDVPFIRDLETGHERPVTTDDHGPEHADWSPDGRSIVYNTYSEAAGLEQIKRVPADDASATPVVLYGDRDHDGFKPAYSPDGSRIVFGCGGDLCLMDADGSNVVKLVDVAGVELNHFAWGVDAK